jgi:hypothetical protein
LHRNEAIVPAAQVMPGGYGGGNVGGGVNVTFQIQALDSSGVQAFFQKNGLQLARILQRQMTLNPSLQGA